MGNIYLLDECKAVKVHGPVDRGAVVEVPAAVLLHSAFAS